MDIVNDLVLWTKDTFAPLGATGLFLLAFIESSFFPIPPDVLLIVLVLDRPELWLFYASVTTVGSALGGMFGYALGYGGKEALLKRLVKEERIEKAHQLFDRHGAWAIFIAAFTPIPYKVFTISAGVFYISFKKFVVASFIGRGMRFFLVAVFIAAWGQPMVSFINDYFDILTIVGVVLVITGYFIYRKAHHGSKKNQEEQRKHRPSKR